MDQMPARRIAITGVVSSLIAGIVLASFAILFGFIFAAFFPLFFLIWVVLAGLILVATVGAMFKGSRLHVGPCPYCNALARGYPPVIKCRKCKNRFRAVVGSPDGAPYFARLAA